MADQFVIESEHSITRALDAGWPLLSALLSDARAASRPDLVARLLASRTTVYLAHQDLLDGLAGFHVHRGALALAPRRPGPSLEQLEQEAIQTDAPLLIVEGVNDHENLGSLFRNAAAFGVGGVILDPATADPLYRRSVRVSVGHALRIPFARCDRWPDGLDRLTESGWKVVALTPTGEATLDHLSGPGPWAVMVGAEGPGLSAPALERAHTRARIPMAGGVDSLNVATAAAIALYHLTR